MMVGINWRVVCGRRQLYGPALLFSTVGMASGAYGQQAAVAQPPGATLEDSRASESRGLQEIVVTAQKREEKLERVPITMTAATADQILARGVQTTEDLPNLSSGLTTSRGLGAGNYFFPYIRGVGSAITSNGIEASVATYVDGVYQADKQSNILDLEGIARVEVLKGPQGTLFGRNATGGAISIITQQPTDTFAAQASVSYGRFNESVERAYVNGPIVPTLDANLSVVARQGGDYLYNIPTAQHFGSTSADTVNGKLRWAPTDQFSVTAGILYSRRRTSDVGANLVPVDGTVPLAVRIGGVTSYQDYTTSLTNVPEAGSTAYQAVLTARYSFAAADLVSITSRQHADLSNLLDYDLTNIPFFAFHLKSATRAWTQELQLVSTDSGPLKWVVGGYFIDQSETYDPLDYLYAGPGGTPVYINDDATLRGEAAFAQGTLDVGANTRLTTGLRYSHERKALTGTQSLPAAGNLVIGTEPAGLAKAFSKPTWRLSLDHDFVEHIMGFVSYNRSFKSGGFNSTLVGPQQAVAPEVLDAYEAGIKSQLLNRRLQLNGAGYYYDYKDIQIQRVGDNGANILQSAGAAKLYGLDFDVNWLLLEDLQLNAGVNLEHSEYTRFDQASGVSAGPGGSSVAVVIPSLKGVQLLNAPNLTFNVGATYTARLGNAGSIDVNPTYAYNSQYSQIPGDLGIVKRQGFVNLTANWNFPGDRWSVGLYGKNLTGVRSLGAYPSIFGVSRQTIRPLTFGITAGFKM